MKNLWTKRNITKFFEIINTKLSSSKKNQQVEVEEEYNFYADDDARFLEYKEWKRKKDLKIRKAPNVNVKRKFKVLSVRLIPFLCLELKNLQLFQSMKNINSRI